MGEDEEEEEPTTTEASPPREGGEKSGGGSSEAFALKMLVDSRNAGAVLGALCLVLFLHTRFEIGNSRKMKCLSHPVVLTYRSLLLWNRQRRRDHQRTAGVDELQNPADANRRGISRDDRTRVDSVRGIAVRLNGFAFDMHEIANGNDTRRGRDYSRKRA